MKGLQIIHFKNLFHLDERNPFDRTNQLFTANRGSVCKAEKIDKVGTVIKYFCKRDMSLKEIHDNFIKILGGESPSYRTVKK